MRSTHWGYTPDFLDDMLKEIDMDSLLIDVQNELTEYEQRLYDDLYQKKKDISQIALEQNITESNVRKRKLRLKNKIIQLVKKHLEKFYAEI